jgi:hypothetical protein
LFKTKLAPPVVGLTYKGDKKMRRRICIILAAALPLLVLALPARGAWDFQRLSNNGGDSVQPAITNTGSNIFVVWQDNSYGNTEIFFKRSLDNASSWDFQRLTNNSGSSLYPDIAVSWAHIHVVWHDTSYYPDPLDILYKRSTDNGVTWSFQRLTNNSGNSYVPTIGVTGSNVHVVWYDNSFGGSYEIFYKRSMDNGSSWSFQRLSSNSGSSQNPDIAVSASPGSSIHVVWEDDTYGNTEILYKRSTSYGSAWDFQRLSNNTAGSFKPSVAVDNTNVHVVWQDNSFGNAEIFYKRSTDNGSSWSFQRITNNSQSSVRPQVAADTGYVKVVWRDFTYMNAEIFYKVSTDNGSTWAFERLTANSGLSDYPAVTYNFSYARTSVVWQDDSYGDDEIFFKQEGP